MNLLARTLLPLVALSGASLAFDCSAYDELRELCLSAGCDFDLDFSICFSREAFTLHTANTTNATDAPTYAPTTAPTAAAPTAAPGPNANVAGCHGNAVVSQATGCHTVGCYQLAYFNGSAGGDKNTCGGCNSSNARYTSSNLPANAKLCSAIEKLPYIKAAMKMTGNLSDINANLETYRTNAQADLAENLFTVPTQENKDRFPKPNITFSADTRRRVLLAAGSDDIIMRFLITAANPTQAAAGGEASDLLTKLNQKIADGTLQGTFIKNTTVKNETVKDETPDPRTNAPTVAPAGPTAPTGNGTTPTAPSATPTAPTAPTAPAPSAAPTAAEVSGSPSLKVPETAVLLLATTVAFFL